MDLLGTHVPKVEFRTGRPTAESIAASDLCAEPMNETAMKQRSAPRPKIRQRHRTNIPVEVYTYGEASVITQVTAPCHGEPAGTGQRQACW